MDTVFVVLISVLSFLLLRSFWDDTNIISSSVLQCPTLFPYTANLVKHNYVALRCGVASKKCIHNILIKCTASWGFFMPGGGCMKEKEVNMELYHSPLTCDKGGGETTTSGLPWSKRDYYNLLDKIASCLISQRLSAAPTTASAPLSFWRRRRWKMIKEYQEW